MEKKSIQIYLKFNNLKFTDFAKCVFLNNFFPIIKNAIIYRVLHLEKLIYSSRFLNHSVSRIKF